MNYYIKFDTSYTCKVVLHDVLENISVPFEVLGLNEISFPKGISDEHLNTLKDKFDYYGIEVIDNQKAALIQKIKDVIVEMVWNDNEMPNVNTSNYLASKLHHSYGYLSNLFSEITYTSIENFIIIQKIERAKQMLLSEQHTLTEISYILNYSSVAHLSAQFKKTTGLTPSLFQKIIKKRREQRSN